MMQNLTNIKADYITSGQMLKDGKADGSIEGYKVSGDDLGLETGKSYNIHNISGRFELAKDMGLLNSLDDVQAAKTVFSNDYMTGLSRSGNSRFQDLRDDLAQNIRANRNSGSNTTLEESISATPSLTLVNTPTSYEEKPTSKVIQISSHPDYVHNSDLETVANTAETINKDVYKQPSNWKKAGAVSNKLLYGIVAGSILLGGLLVPYGFNQHKQLKAEKLRKANIAATRSVVDPILKEASIYTNPANWTPEKKLFGRVRFDNKKTPDKEHLDTRERDELITYNGSLERTGNKIIAESEKTGKLFTSNEVKAYMAATAPEVVNQNWRFWEKGHFNILNQDSISLTDAGHVAPINSSTRDALGADIKHIPIAVCAGIKAEDFGYDNGRSSRRFGQAWNSLKSTLTLGIIPKNYQEDDSWKDENTFGVVSGMPRRFVGSAFDTLASTANGITGGVTGKILGGAGNGLKATAHTIRDGIEVGTSAITYPTSFLLPTNMDVIPETVQKTVAEIMDFAEDSAYKLVDDNEIRAYGMSGNENGRDYPENLVGLGLLRLLNNKSSANQTQTPDSGSLGNTGGGSMLNK